MDNEQVEPVRQGSYLKEFLRDSDQKIIESLSDDDLNSYITLLSEFPEDF